MAIVENRGFAGDVTTPIGLRECHVLLQRLSGEEEGSEDARKALNKLGGSVRATLLGLLEELLPEKAIPVHLDLSTSSELLALPFEACFDRDGDPLFAGRETPIILTRRVREDPETTPHIWPVRPRILFITASHNKDLDQRVISNNENALREALDPWIESLGDTGEHRANPQLTKLVDPTLDSIERIFKKAREEHRPYTHVHILAHGKETPCNELPADRYWGLNLNQEENVGPKQLATAIAPKMGLPAVVTIAACNSGDAASPYASTNSLAQELHKSGVPVVVGSQLPLQKWSTLVLAESFYPLLFQGEDVRWALYQLREALYEDTSCGHDWMGMVAYVNLHKDYAGQLLETALQSELAMLDTTVQWADGIESMENPDRNLIRRTGNALRKRIASLNLRRLKKDAPPVMRQEIDKALGAAHKRLAQFIFERGAVDQSRRELKKARGRYHNAFNMNFNNHREAIQWLSIDAIISGSIKRSHWETLYEALVPDDKSYPEDPYALSTVAELSLIAPLAGLDSRLSEGKEILQRLRRLCQESYSERPQIDKSQRQLARYIHWWTKPNGFFSDRDEDLSSAARELLQIIDVQIEHSNADKSS